MHDIFDKHVHSYSQVPIKHCNKKNIYSGYYEFNMSTQNTFLCFCSLTHTLFQKVFHNKERQCKEYSLVNKKKLTKDNYRRTPSPNIKLAHSKGEKANHMDSVHQRFKQGYFM
jgi:hypothetical protein